MPGLSQKQLEINERKPMKNPLPASIKRAGRAVARWQGWRMTTSSLRAWPSFIIIGTKKGGTTTFFWNLVRHPNIIPPLHKELHYFDWHYDRPVAHYLSFFPLKWHLQRRHAITGEASPDYMFYPQAAERIKAALPNIKLIIMLRDPVQRAYSHYRMNVQFYGETRSFEDIIQAELASVGDQTVDSAFLTGRIKATYLLRGVYIAQIRVWQAHFPPEQLLILDSKDYFDAPLTMISQIASDYLSLPGWAVEDYIDREPRNKLPAQPIPDPIYQAMRAFYRPYNEQLFTHLGREFRWPI
jgi:hypothetical protein